MSEDKHIKVCGLTRSQDVEQVLRLGGDYCGFIVYAPSPRAVSIVQARDLSSKVPIGRRVLVDVSPSVDRLKVHADSGFDFFQIHTDATMSERLLDEWATAVGVNRLWLAPRLKPRDEFPEYFLNYADSFLVDTYSSNQIGGTGQTGDWGSFSDWKERYSQKQWILAGGLNPENIEEAIEQTGAAHLDLNSGLESKPGIKDHQKLEALFKKVKPQTK